MTYIDYKGETIWEKLRRFESYNMKECEYPIFFQEILNKKMQHYLSNTALRKMVELIETGMLKPYDESGF